MKKFAHRGYSEYYPENTMIAFKEACKMKFDGIETDVQMTKDGHLVLIHDEKIDRTSNGKGWVKDYQYKQLLAYNFSYGQDLHQSIPQLEELLVLIKDKDIMLNLEIKTNVIQYEGIEEKIVALVKKHHLENKVYYSSFYLPSLLKVKELQPDAYLAYLIEEDYKQQKEEVFKYHLTGIHPRLDLVTHEDRKRFKDNNINVGCWTVLKDEDYKRAVELDLDWIFSNRYFD